MTANRLRLAVFFVIVAFSAQLFAAGIAQSASNVDGINIDVLSLERKGNVLTLKWAVTNSGEKSANVDFALTGSSRVSTYLVDEDSGTKYYALTDKEGNVLASEHEYTGGPYGISETIPAGQTKRFWAKFPAPPAAVKTINIFFTEAEPVEDVAITDKK